MCTQCNTTDDYWNVMSITNNHATFPSLFFISKTIQVTSVVKQYWNIGDFESIRDMELAGLFWQVLSQVALEQQYETKKLAEKCSHVNHVTQ